MTISHVGTLPVSSVNLGLTMAPAGYAALAADLTAKMAKLQGNLTFAATVTPIDPVALVSGMAQAALGVALSCDPTQIISASGAASIDLVAQLGLVDLSLAVAGPLVAQFEAGLDAGGLSSWSYSGPVAEFGQSLARQTADGWPGVPRTDTVQAVLIACESRVSWTAFGQGFRTGGTEARDGTVARLDWMGRLGADELSIGVQAALNVLQRWKLDLQNLKASIETQLQVCVGLNLPTPDVQLAALLEVDPLAALTNMLSVDLAGSLLADIGALQADIDALAQLTLDLGLQLSAGGLTVWSYGGPAAMLGEEFSAVTAGGLPGGQGPGAPCWGLVVACEVPAIWATFGGIFIT